MELINEIIKKLEIYCHNYNSIYQSINHIFDMLTLFEMELVINNEKEFNENYIPIINLDLITKDFKEIEIKVKRSLKMISLTKNLLTEMKPETLKLIENNSYDDFKLILSKINTNASFIPLWIKMVKEMKYLEETYSNNLIKIISSITENCWKFLSEINNILDILPVDRTKYGYCHLPENESELLIKSLDKDSNSDFR